MDQQTFMINLARLGTHPPACPNWQPGACQVEGCGYLHQRLSVVGSNPKPKKPCRNGPSCKWGERCKFQH